MGNMEKLQFIMLLITTIYLDEVVTDIVFTVVPGSKAVVFGEDLTLDCDAHDTADPTKRLTFDWFFNSVSSPAGSSIFTNHSLLVRAVSQTNLGNYTCGIMSDDGKSVLALSPPSVVIHAFIKTFLSNPSSLHVTEGEIVELECVSGESAPTPVVMWEKDGKPFYEGDQYTSVFGMSTIPGVIAQFAMKLVMETSSYDSGSYNCLARNTALGVEVRSLKVDLVVEALERAPYVDNSLYLRDVIAPRDQPLQIMCPIRGYPVPHITWEFNGAPFISSDYSLIFPNGSIFIANLEENHDGPYMCEGVNFLGSVRSPVINVKAAFIELDFISEPYRVFTIAGQPQTLPCTPPRSYPLATVTWYKDNNPVIYRSGKQAVFIVDPANAVWDLFFAEIQKQDEGEYFCVATNNYSVPTTRTSSTAVLSVGGAPIFLQPPIGVTAIKGEGIQLTCLVDGDPFPDVLWLQDRRDIVPNSQVAFSRDNQEIHIADINKAFEGTYTCRASNNYGIRESDAYVRVLVPVVITNPVSNITAKAGSEVKVTCGVYGDPEPTVVWYKDNVVLTPGGRFSKVDDGLIISDLKIADAGTYGCQVTNEAGEASSQAELAVLASPFFIQIPEDQVVLYGQGFNLTCEVDGNPKPSVDWLFNGTNLFPPGIFVSLDKRHLQVTDASWLHVGKYTCVAASMEGAISTTAIIALHVPPRVYRIVGNAIVYITKDLELTCLVDGVPAPSINWKHNGQQVGPSFDGRVSFPERHRLLVKVAQISDAGEYKCVADNVAGRSEMAIDVFVIEPPIPPQLMDPVPISSSAIQVSWKPVTQKTHTLVSQYILYFKEKLQLEYSQFPDIILGTETSVTLQDLIPGMEYLFTVAGVNSAGEGEKSNVKISKTFDSGPSAPRNLHVISTGPTEVELEWEIPAQTNGQIKKYKIWYKPRNGGLGPKTLEFFVSDPAEAAPTHTVPNLDPYTDYEFSVQAATIENGIEMWGNLSTTIDTRTGVAAPIGSPLDLMVIPLTPYDVQVTWNTVPLPLQRGPILKYHVRYRPAATFALYTNIIVDNSDLKVNISNLLPWSWYSFLVEAENEGGVGPPSSEIVVRTNQAAPSGKPVNLTVQAIAMDTIQVMFSLPDPGTWNSDLTGFLVEYGKHNDNSDTSETINTYSIQTLHLNISNLEPWTEYEVRVALISGPFDTLQGPYTDWIIVKTKEGAPGTVRSVAFTTTPTSITLTWDPPIQQNGIIQGYMVDYYIISAAVGADGQLPMVSITTITEEAVLSDLVPSTRYSVTVSAFNGAGKGDNQSLIIMTGDLPSPPPPPVTSPPTPSPVPPSTTYQQQTQKLTSSDDLLAPIVGGSLAGVLLVVIVIVLGTCMCIKWRTTHGTVGRTKTPEQMIIDNESRDSSSRAGSGTSSVVEEEETGQFGQVDINIDDVRFDANSTVRSRSVPEGYGSLKGASNMTLQVPSLARSAHSITGVQNPMFLGDHHHNGYQLDEDQESMAVSMAISAEEVYSQASNTLKRKSRMRSESAAAIAVMRTSAMPDIGSYHGTDTDTLIQNDSVVIFTERTAL